MTQIYLILLFREKKIIGVKPLYLKSPASHTLFCKHFTGPFITRFSAHRWGTKSFVFLIWFIFFPLLSSRQKTVLVHQGNLMVQKVHFGSGRFNWWMIERQMEEKEISILCWYKTFLCLFETIFSTIMNEIWKHDY